MSQKKKKKKLKLLTRYLDGLLDFMIIAVVVSFRATKT